MECTHRFLLIEEEFAPGTVYSSKSAHVCFLCGTFLIWMNGEIMSFVLSNEEMTKAAGMYMERLLEDMPSTDLDDTNDTDESNESSVVLPDINTTINLSITFSGPGTVSTVAVPGVTVTASVSTDEPDDGKSDDDDPSKWAVYSRPECVFAYCVNPKICSAHNYCQHKMPPSDHARTPGGVL